MEVTSEGFTQAVESLRATGRPFAVATVIHVKGSASAKPGSRAVIDETGKNIWGWVGGGCAESFVGREAVLAMEENRTRIVQADLDDEIFGLGMPCGGIMDVFIQPERPPLEVKLTETRELEPVLSHLAQALSLRLNFRETEVVSAEAPLERGLVALARAIAEARNVEPRPLRETKSVYKGPAPKLANFAGEPELLILGHSRITEEIAKLSTIARWKTRVYGPDLDRALYPDSAELEDVGAGYENLRVTPGSAVIVASHHKGDHDFIRLALEQGAAYVGLIASQKRSGLVFQHLSERLPEEKLRSIYAPAGLNLACETPQEIALSCLAEIIELRRGAIQ